MNVDSLANAHGSGASLILKTSDNMIIEQSLWFRFRATKNEAEYKALIAGLKLAQSLKVSKIKILSDSQLVINQINRECATKDMKMFVYLSKVKKLQFELKEFSIEQLPRSKNSNANTPTNLGSSISSEYRRTILIEILTHPSIMDVEDVYSTEKKDETWKSCPIFRTKAFSKISSRHERCRALLQNIQC